MKFRIPLTIVALLLPVLAAVAIARFSLPSMVPRVIEKANEVVAKKEEPQEVPDVTVPETLAQARQLTIKRLVHLQKMTQAEWDKERQTILHKHPPKEINEAIARAQLRLGDLNAMKEDDWPKEKEKLLARQKKLQGD